MGLFGEKAGSVGANEAFVCLIQIAREDEAVKQKLLTILSQDNFNRASILNAYIEDMRLKRAPKEFISAVACLLEDGIAEKARQILAEQS